MRASEVILRMLLLFGLLCIRPQSLSAFPVSGRFKVSASTVSFASEMPMELIRATSGELNGVLDLENGIFSFRLPVRSFKGFNNPLQQEHFNENYMETSSFPFAAYKGKLIDDPDISKPGTYRIRTKGYLSIHGHRQTVLIPVTLEILRAEAIIRFNARFTLLLTDFGIKIPRIVDKNLSNEIQVDVEGELIPL